MNKYKNRDGSYSKYNGYFGSEDMVEDLYIDWGWDMMGVEIAKELGIFYYIRFTVHRLATKNFLRGRRWLRWNLAKK